MRKLLPLALLTLLIGCAEKEWTEGVSIGGLKRGLSTQVKYDIGGKTTFKAYLESEVYQKLVYPITITIYLNNEICDTSITKEPESQIITKAECTGDLGKGLHTYEVKVTSINGLDYISNEDDLQYNRIEGPITYTLESSI
ncbi:hypothetical protein [Pseudoalteromonas ruthenica]|uniref:hypothetical protein n=1 Tax=Pseudoalteromonas ruthenica TaxID=151081 RepID=UPI0003B7A3D9|nr:hypothetical protein [Pseudoalteromonas ruthenica]